MPSGDESFGSEGVLLSRVRCPKCGRESGDEDPCGVASVPVMACARCDYCSIDGDPDVVDGDDRGFGRALPDDAVSTDDAETTISDVRGTRRDFAGTVSDSAVTGTRVTDLALANAACVSASEGSGRGSAEKDLLEQVDESVPALCQSCDVTDSKCLFNCKDCGNNSPAWFCTVSCTSSIQIICLICLTVVRPAGTLALPEILRNIAAKKERKNRIVLKESAKRTHKRVRDLRQLQCGDHIAWDREYLVWHHAIVTDVQASTNHLTVIHNSGGIKDMPNGRIASVRVETFEVDCDVEFLYMFQYDEDECFSPDEVIERATQRLDERYDPLTNNCEHFARWCKTGVKYSIQRKDFDDRLKMGASGFAKVIEESLVTAVRFFVNSESMQDILGVTATNAWAIIDARLGFLTGSTKVVHGLQIGAVLMGIMLAIFAEIVFFCCKLYEYKKDADAMDMPADVFQRGVFQLFSEGLVGLGGGLGAAFGMSLVPYAGPFLSPIGYVLGNWLGRLIGALIGRLIMRILHRNKILYR